MGLIQSKMDLLYKICFRWYEPIICREIITPEGIKVPIVAMEDEGRNNFDKPQNQQGWAREEMVLLVAEYFRTKYLETEQKKDSIRYVSYILRKRAEKNGDTVSETYRNVNGIQMQSACITKYDPEMIEKGIRGLRGGSRLMESVVNEYIAEPERIKAEAYDVICKYSM